VYAASVGKADVGGLRAAGDEHESDAEEEWSTCSEDESAEEDESTGSEGESAEEDEPTGSEGF
jgi:hypothetical protein